jgi:hypothetical protein
MEHNTIMKNNKLIDNILNSLNEILDIKLAISSAIREKGGEIIGEFNTYANAISNLSSGIDLSNTNIEPSSVLINKTFRDENGEILSGSMPFISVINSQSGEYTFEPGYNQNELTYNDKSFQCNATTNTILKNHTACVGGEIISGTYAPSTTSSNIEFYQCTAISSNLPVTNIDINYKSIIDNHDSSVYYQYDWYRDTKGVWNSSTSNLYYMSNEIIPSAIRNEFNLPSGGSSWLFSNDGNENGFLPNGNGGSYFAIGPETSGNPVGIYKIPSTLFLSGSLKADDDMEYQKITEFEVIKKDCNFIPSINVPNIDLSTSNLYWLKGKISGTYQLSGTYNNCFTKYRTWINKDSPNFYITCFGIFGDSAASVDNNSTYILFYRFTGDENPPDDFRELMEDSSNGLPIYLSTCYKDDNYDSFIFDITNPMKLVSDVEKPLDYLNVPELTGLPSLITIEEGDIPSAYFTDNTIWTFETNWSRKKMEFNNFRGL